MSDKYHPLNYDHGAPRPQPEYPTSQTIQVPSFRDSIIHESVSGIPKKPHVTYQSISTNATHHQSSQMNVPIHQSTLAMHPKELTGTSIRRQYDPAIPSRISGDMNIVKQYETTDVKMPHQDQHHENASEHQTELVFGSSTPLASLRPDPTSEQNQVYGQFSNLPKLPYFGRPTEYAVPAFAVPNHHHITTITHNQNITNSYMARDLLDPIGQTSDIQGQSTEKLLDKSKGYSEQKCEPQSEQLQLEIGKAAEYAFRTLGPLMKVYKVGDFHSLLMGILEYCDDSESVEDFYELLFDPTHTMRKYSFTERFHTFDISQRTHLKSKGLKLVFLVLSFLRSPEDTICHVGGDTIDEIKRPAIDPHEFARSFFAVRILKAVIRESDPSSVSNHNISRECVYGAYSILCQRLILKNALSLNPLAQMKQLILGRSQIQKFSKLVFPNLTQKKFQRKDDTRVYYIGASWNDAVIDEATKQMILKGVTDVMSYEKHLGATDEQPSADFRVGPQTVPRIRYQPSMPPRMPPLIPPINVQLCELKLPQLNVQRMPPVIPPITPPLFSRSPMSTFVGPFTAVPKKDCSPRDWSREKERIPKHSRWALTVMQKSLNTISRYGVRGDLIVRNFKAGDFSEAGATSLPFAVVAAMTRLKEVSAPSTAYLHFYRAMMMLMLPAITASESEISSEKRGCLRRFLKRIVTNLESETFFDSEEDRSNLRIFTETVRSMRLLDDLKSTTVRTEDFEEIVKMLIHDIDQLGLSGTGSSMGTDISGDAFARSLDTLTNDFGFDLPKLSRGNETKEDIVNVLHQMRGVFSSHLKLFKEGIFEVLHSVRDRSFKEPVQTLAYEIAMKQIEIFHGVSFKDPMISQLPINVLTFSLLLLMVQIQNLSFYQFGNQGPRLSRVCFETWYVSCSVTHDYLRVICEIIALNEKLG